MPDEQMAKPAVTGGVRRGAVPRRQFITVFTRQHIGLPAIRRAVAADTDE